LPTWRTTEVDAGAGRVPRAGKQADEVSPWCLLLWRGQPRGVVIVQYPSGSVDPLAADTLLSCRVRHSSSSSGAAVLRGLIESRVQRKRVLTDSCHSPNDSISPIWRNFVSWT
ncbi:unnamed protein product, partial [Laminaria digitata]